MSTQVAVAHNENRGIIEIYANLDAAIKAHEADGYKVIATLNTRLDLTPGGVRMEKRNDDPAYDLFDEKYKTEIVMIVLAEVRNAGAALGSIKTEKKAATSKKNGQLGGRLANSRICHLTNPWSGSSSTMTWAEIRTWAKEHVHPDDLKAWISAARRAAIDEDSVALGKMIIGA